MLHLLVGIDTESDNQWDLAARERPTFDNLYALPALHALFRRHGVRPTYVITYPVAKDARWPTCCACCASRGPARLARTITPGRRPPCAPEDMRRHPYAADLPREQFERSWAR